MFECMHRGSAVGYFISILSRSNLGPILGDGFVMSFISAMLGRHTLLCTYYALYHASAQPTWNIASIRHVNCPRCVCFYMFILDFVLPPFHSSVIRTRRTLLLFSLYFMSFSLAAFSGCLEWICHVYYFTTAILGYTIV
jgi:hypothetical protein